ncbi:MULTISPECIES: DUF3622 domain-containing protein [unclassified Shewanella]|uniref:DUF3622 domain-containing protein n=1 Tax=unclassified Shewanella TaxID=196818 RepID=UPI001BC1849A|nr:MULTISPECIES: DUF3622 domain-containing protein [unclassified Shewanella]GIU06037.1 hypothetical protein TUM4444_03390 [Shewanella sp. MBTL60-112-B1]GIU25513.1 hypothetical protein TUM4445_03730 [Shewanella sp. MBTL60-112-B2]
MTQTKKYDFRVVADGATWTGQITRRQTARKIVVSKSKKGFATEAEAQAWGETELKSFLENLIKRNERKAKARGERNEAAEAKELAADAWRDAREAKGSDKSFDEDNLDYESDSER